MQPHRQSPFTALCQLLMFKRKLFPLTEAEFDLAFDTLVQVLEEVNDEKYRVTPRSESV